MNIYDLLRRRRRPRPPRPETIISRHIGKAIGALILGGAAALFNLKGTGEKTASAKIQNSAPTSSYSQQDLSENGPLFQALQSGREVPFIQINNAKVVKLLRNDNRGAKHQRWIVQVGSESVTVVHNIDLAEKVPISVGDTLELAGELIFGSKKGDPILHWTHDDPKNKRLGGYIIHNGKKYGALVTQNQ